MSPARRPPAAQADAYARAARRRSRRRRRSLLLVLVVGVGVLVLWRPGPLGRSTADGVALDPAAFSPGACVAFAPTSGDRHTTVFLDAGHGGLDPGAVGSTSSGVAVDEGTVTLPVELDAMQRLRGAGYRVVVSRTTDSNVVRLTPADLSGGELSLQGAHDDVAARDVCANLSGASALIGIYFDSGASPSDGGSVTTYDADRPFSAANLRLATLVQKDSVEGSLVPTSSSSPIAVAAAHYGHVLLLGPADPGFFTTPSSMPGALIEPLFVTDPFEGTLAAGPAAQQVIAGGIARAVEQYLGSGPTGSGSTG